MAVSAPGLENLRSEQLLLPAIALNSGPALIAFFRRRKEVRDVKKALERGSITNVSVRRFVDRLMVDLQKGVLFPHDKMIAALAVALEDASGAWIDKFLAELSSLKVAEMPFGPRVAHELVNHRHAVRMNLTAKVAPAVKK